MHGIPELTGFFVFVDAIWSRYALVNKGPGVEVSGGIHKADPRWRCEGEITVLRGRVVRRNKSR
jgi:hypothetical protein